MSKRIDKLLEKVIHSGRIPKGIETDRDVYEELRREQHVFAADSVPDGEAAGDSEESPSNLFKGSGEVTYETQHEEEIPVIKREDMPGDYINILT
jgi:hypothetical protein